MLTLYHGKTSVCSAKVRLCLAEIGCDWSGKIVDLAKGEQNATWYLSFNPKAVVPTLVDDDLVVTESAVILEYLVKKFDAGNLRPTDPHAWVTAKMWLAECRDIHAAINSLTYAIGKRRKILSTKSADEIAASLARMANPANASKRRDILEHGVDSEHVAAACFTLRLMFDKMHSALAQGEWLLGAHYSLADTALLSYVDRLDRLGLSGLWDKRTPLVQRWLGQSRQRASYSLAIEDFAGSAEGDRKAATAAENWTLLAPKWAAASG
ncbi:glutathione S-transferase [Shimia isoporae]|uniref:Glutathione S-transferase n=1 Tax=Shimia isoporae TaxID=647720 RepID=A0A4R1NTK8_9RHOB|nr:glutathione S-transferase family protein [Shimia isoporae]TCL08332.1 glutathione S-transferase [Shimia isoporae]